MDRKNLAAIAAAFALGAGGATVAQRPAPPPTPKVIEAPAGPMDVCLRPPLRVAECQAWKTAQKDAGR